MGRVITMSKRKKSKIIYSREEKILISLHRLSHMKDAEENDKKTAKSLTQWYIRHGSWTPAQTKLASHLSVMFKRIISLNKQSLIDKYYLYAIRINNHLKVGYSSNVEKRLNTYKTGNHDVEVMAKISLKGGITQAKTQEKRLHKYINKYLIERELFELGALPLILEWNLK